MKMDKIQIGKTYSMGRRALPRRVLDIIWYPAGGKYVREYRVAEVEILGGKNGTVRVRENLGWLAENAREEIPADIGGAT